MPEEGPDEGRSKPGGPSGDEYRKLADSADQLRASEKQRASDQTRRRAQQQTTAWLKYTTVGLQFVLMLLLPLGLGYWVDTFFDTLPFGTLIGFALGGVAAMVSIIRETSRMGKLDGPDKKREAVSFLPYMLVAGLAIMLAVSVGAIALIGLDAYMLNGVVTGATTGLILMVFAWFTTLKGINSGDVKNALGHVLGGFMLRLIVLTVGVVVLYLTGWANPAGFAIAFLMAVMVYLAMQILVALRRHQGRVGEVKTA